MYECSLKNLEKYGSDGIFKQDMVTVVNWCDSLAYLEQAIMQHEELFLAKSHGAGAKDAEEAANAVERWETFHQLLNVTKCLRQLFPPRSRL